MSFELILIYPSKQSVIDLFLAALERNTNADLPDGWPDNEPLRLQENDAASFGTFQEVLDDVINGAEPAPTRQQALTPLPSLRYRQCGMEGEE